MLWRRRRQVRTISAGRWPSCLSCLVQAILQRGLLGSLGDGPLKGVGNQLSKNVKFVQEPIDRATDGVIEVVASAVEVVDDTVDAAA